MNRDQMMAVALGAGAIGAALMARYAWREEYDFAGTSVLITGGSRGLGLLMARELAAEGARLTILARDPEELTRARADLEARGALVHTIVCDVRNRGEIEAAVESAVQRFGGLDVLINNAGVIQVGPVEQMRIEDYEENMAVHFWGPLYAMRAALPHLRQHSSSRIINIASIGGKIAVPHLAPYSASKFALVGLSDAFRAEFARYGVRITTVCPGLMRTGSHLNAEVKGHHEQEFAWFAITTALPIASMDARRAARQILDASRRGDPDIVLTLQAWLASRVAALFPGATAWMTSAVNSMLPEPNPGEGEERRRGYASTSAWAPSALTNLADREAPLNNEGPLPSVTRREDGVTPRPGPLAPSRA
jgi:NAD(P)-dependent dehydrogenase (short-subunit alcohol dehydrogenase family)